MTPGSAAGARPARPRRRRRARRAAVDILFQADLTGRPPVAVLEGWRSNRREVAAYTEELVLGAAANLGEIDSLLEGHTRDWALHRLAAVDRAIMRVACQELLAGVPAPIAVSEAVEAAQELSTEASGRFVNGVLGSVARDLPAMPAGGGPGR